MRDTNKIGSGPTGDFGWRRPAQKRKPLLPSAQQQRLEEILVKLAGIPGPLLPILHEVQQAFGYVPPAAVPHVAEALNLSRAEVHGVLTFYHDFRTEPAARHIVKLCRAEACQARGGRDLEAHARRALAIGMDESTSDGVFALEATYCLGHCAVGPCMTIDDFPYAHVDAARFDALLSQARADE